MDDRTRLLVRASALASRYEHREALRDAIVAARESGAVTRTELYESCLQIYLFAGFPAGLEAARALSKAWPAETEDALASATRETMSYPTFLERGQKLYQEIYSRNADVVRNEMLKLSPELAAWAVIEGYGKTLARSGLDVPTRELCIVAVLTHLGWERQLFSHILGASNVGVSDERIAEAIAIGAMHDPEREARALALLDRKKSMPGTPAS